MSEIDGEKMNDLITNIEKLHTTELGVQRIKKNLSLDTDDVVKWCKEAINQADIIIRQRKIGIYTIRASC